MCLQPWNTLGPQTHIDGVFEPQNPSKPLWELRYDLGAYNTGHRTPKTYNLRGKHEFTAQAHAWTVNTLS